MMCGDNQGIIEKFLKRVEKSLEKDSVAPKTNKLESKIFDLTKKRQKLVDNYMDGTIDRDVYQTKDKDYKEELKELQKEYNHIKSQAMDKETVKERIENFRKILSDKQVMTAFDRDIFENMIDTIIAGGIDENGEKDPYKITFIFNTGYKQEIGNSKKQYKEKEKAEKCSLTVDEGKESVLSKSSTGMWRR